MKKVILAVMVLTAVVNGAYASDLVVGTTEPNTTNIASNKNDMNILGKVAENHEERIQTLEQDNKGIKFDVANTQNQVNINTKDIADLKGRIGANVTVSAGDNITVNEDSGNFTVSTSNDLQLNSVSLNDGNNESAYTTEGINMTYRGDGASGLEYHTSYKYDGIAIRTNDGDANDVSYISLTDNGLNNGNKRITNIDKGIEGTDAVNVNQLKAVNSKVDKNTSTIDLIKKQGDNRIVKLEQTVTGDINQLNARINKLGASSAALAGLHPMEFNKDDKFSASVAYGHYKNANAVALGAYYRPNEKVLFGIAGTFGSENMYNVSVSFKFGKHSEYEPQAKRDGEIEAMKAQIAELTARLDVVSK